MPGFKVLLMGGSGSGKTYSACSLAKTGLKVRWLMNENCLPTISRYFADRGEAIPSNIAWHYVPQAQIGLKELIEMSKSINTFSFKLLTEMTDPNRGKHIEFIQMLEALASYTDQRTGEVLGSVEDWGDDTVLVLEGLTGLSNAVMNLVTGGKPIRGQQDWQVAQNHLERFLDKLTHLQCHYLLTAHIDRETDEVAGGSKIMPSTLGKKLAPKLGRFFDDVIQASREGKRFQWATDTLGSDLKTRHLDIAGNIDPSFDALYARWKALNDSGKAVLGVKA